MSLFRIKNDGRNEKKKKYYVHSGGGGKRINLISNRSKRQFYRSQFCVCTMTVLATTNSFNVHYIQ